jgi:hypothetical protein
MHSHSTSHGHGPMAQLYCFLTYLISQIIIPAIILFMQPLEAFRTKLNGYFSQSGLTMLPHRARMSDSLLETLVFLKCNAAIAFKEVLTVARSYYPDTVRELHFRNTTVQFLSSILSLILNHCNNLAN